MATEERTALEAWAERYTATPERPTSFTTLSGEPIQPLYTEQDLPAPEAIGLPGEFPFTRGVYPSMYRGRLWTMRQFAGFGTAEETNERFRYLLAHGQDRVSAPPSTCRALMGYDSDHALSAGRGRPRGRRRSTRSTTCRPSSTGIDLGEISVSMTDQRAGGGHARLLRRRGAVANGIPARSPQAARSRPTSSRSTSPRRSGASRSTRRCGCCGDMIEWSAPARCRAGTRSRSPATTSARPARRRRRSSRSRSRTDSPTSSRRFSARVGHRRLRAAPELLLQRTDRLLRGGREVSRRAAHLGARAARDASVRRIPAVVADALSHVQTAGVSR